jgi:hypothetical protein
LLLNPDYGWTGQRTSKTRVQQRFLLSGFYNPSLVPSQEGRWRREKQHCVREYVARSLPYDDKARGSRKAWRMTFLSPVGDVGWSSDANYLPIAVFETYQAH